MSPARTCTAFLLAACLAAPAHAADPTDAARYVPKDANIVVVVKMDQLLASQGFKKLRQEVPNVDKEFEGGFMKEFGFEVSNVERMSMAIIAKQGRPIGVFQLKTAVKPDTVVKAASAPRFDGDKGTMFTQEKVGAMTVYVPNQEFREAFCFVNAKTIVYGKAKELKAVLEANAKPVLSEGLQTALKSADPKAIVMVAVDGKALADEKGPPIPGVDFKAITDTVKGASFTVTGNGADVLLRGVAVCKDAKGAEAVKAQAEAVRKFVMEQMKSVPPNVIPKGVMEIPAMVKMTTKGSSAEATLTVKADDAVALIKATMVPIQGRTTSPPPLEVKPIKPSAVPTPVKPPVEKKP